MEFKKLNLRGIILVSVAGVAVIWTVIAKLTAHASMPEQSQIVATPAVDKPPVSDYMQAAPVQVKPIIVPKQPNEQNDDDLQSIKDMKEQMDNDRLQQKRIKMLKLQLEQTNLQLEQEKAMAEIGKLEKENTNVVSDSDNPGQDKYPEVKVMYIGGSETAKEAILQINGNNYLVEDKNRPIKSMEVVSITDSSVTVHFSLPQDLKTTIEYKPE